MKLKYNNQALLNNDYPYLFGQEKINCESEFAGNIEKFIGLTQIPTGLVGPLKVNGSNFNEEVLVPLATTEGALVASYNRGSKACFEAGGISSVVVDEGVQRCPVFKFNNLKELLFFLKFVDESTSKFQEITSQSSRLALLKSIEPLIEGNHLILTFNYSTGDASGQNMVTFCTENICKFLIEESPIQPILWYIEGNFSGDKKANFNSFTKVRGKKVVAEVVLPQYVLEKTLKTSANAMFNYWLTSTMGVIQSGAIGAQGHYANGLAALFLATGQDIACVAEAAIGITRMEVVNKTDLYIAVTLPNLIIGTVGGGTSLPTQTECLEMMNCKGLGKANQFAEIAAALVLAGEVSIAAALSAHHFASAHKQLGRK